MFRTHSDGITFPLRSEMGPTFKTIAQSIFTPVSFASLVTGLNPPRHGVKDFDDTLPEEYPTIFDLDLHTSYLDHPDDPMYRVLNGPDRISLDNLSEPFLYLERSLATHHPYDPAFNGNADEYLRKMRGKKGELKEDYSKAVDMAKEEFLDRIEVLKNRDILNDTLVIFTSDHGDILGEYGPMFHTFPVCPENVYVPTVFVSPKPLGSEGKGVIRQVDILPTVLDLLDLDSEWPTEGINVFQNRRELVGFNYYQRAAHGSIESVSVWDREGGYVEQRGSHWDLVKTAVLDMITYTHSLDPLRYAKSEIHYGEGMENAEQVVRYFENQPSYGYKEDPSASPSLEGSRKMKEQLSIGSKIRDLKERGKIE
ncbi:hypothetical protein AKJ64_04800 [candidate division MSBL1 archaeon SCGC-AAA259E17]|uniref:Sulfatase N-terminal domain-containing protein n=1 Tax=candidate division MSBL1 archaeon SCGC-AAA259E17 TaxID=1698263 RepID=A0A133UAX3_9EURY|nr:hypothetical protein AKJ64_04800 [candidate division MSBL1 archaeon SCGC-AAA259E17]